MYNNLPNTGLNLSLPIYLIVGLVMLIVGGFVLLRDKITG